MDKDQGLGAAKAASPDDLRAKMAAVEKLLSKGRVGLRCLLEHLGPDGYIPGAGLPATRAAQQVLAVLDKYFDGEPAVIRPIDGLRLGCRGLEDAQHSFDQDKCVGWAPSENTLASGQQEEAHATEAERGTDRPLSAADRRDRILRYATKGSDHHVDPPRGSGGRESSGRREPGGPDDLRSGRRSEAVESGRTVLNTEGGLGAAPTEGRVVLGHPDAGLLELASATVMGNTANRDPWSGTRFATEYRMLAAGILRERNNGNRLADALERLLAEVGELGEHKFTFQAILDSRKALRAAGRKERP